MHTLWRCVLLLYLCECCQCLASRDEFLGTNLQQEIPGSFPGKGNLFPGAVRHPHPMREYDPPPPDPRYPVIHAGLPRGLAVEPLPLEGGDHELVFNVSWLPSLGPPAKDYSLEVISDSTTDDCRSPICYEYNIFGHFNWHIVPTLTNPVAETCSIRPGCAYLVRLIAHPWDGHTVANLRVQLKECEAGVCSCAYAPYLPTPIVQARTSTQQGDLVANISWTLPPPHYPLRLPKDVQKKLYFVSIGKQMVSDAHPSPWFAHAITRHINTTGPLLVEDSGSVLVPIDRNIERRDRQQRILIDVKLLARVNLIDNRGCVGPAGNASAYDPVEANKVRIGTYLLWAALGGTCVLAMIAVLAVSARAVKRVLNALRPPPVSAPLDPLARRPAWFPLQLRT